MHRSPVQIAVLLYAVPATIWLSGCGSEPTPEPAKMEAVKKPAIPEGPVPALTAYYEIYKAARTLAPDLQAASVTGIEVDEVKSTEGKYAQWKVVFVSASKQQAFTFLYSTIEKGMVLRGINNQGTQKWAGPTQTAEPFTNADFPSIPPRRTQRHPTKRRRGLQRTQANPSLPSRSVTPRDSPRPCGWWCGARRKMVLWPT